jgi:hypothetical protein
VNGYRAQPVFSKSIQQIPSQILGKRAERISLSLRERAGVRGNRTLVVAVAGTN